MRRDWFMVGGLVTAVLLFGSVVVGCDATGGSGDPPRSATSTSSATGSADGVETTFPATQGQPPPNHWADLPGDWARRAQRRLKGG